MTRIFVAYPSVPQGIGEVIEAAAKQAKQRRPDLELQTWRRDDLGGEQLVAPILEAITAADIVVADITEHNFNVTYELGYGIGLGKRGLPVRNSVFEFDSTASQKIGIFDTLIHQEYATAESFIEILAAADVGRRLSTDYPYDPLPLYMVLPPVKDDDINQLIARANKAGLRARTFDPLEQPRLSAVDAVRKTASSFGVVVPLLSAELADAKAHNLRCAFVAGLSHALNKPTLILQKGGWSTPLDLRDEVASFTTHLQIKNLFQDFAEKVHDARYATRLPVAGPHNWLAALNLGDPAAENEETQLNGYFLESDGFRQVLDGRANIVVGRKGAGKTAVYFQTRDRLKSARANVIVDLSPEAYQLRKLKDLVLRWLAAGSKEFLLAAFWEYVLLLEICGKIIDKDRDVHKRNHALFEPYQRLLKLFRTETVTEGVNFSDRLLILLSQKAAGVGGADSGRLGRFIFRHGGWIWIFGRMAARSGFRLMFPGL